MTVSDDPVDWTSLVDAVGDRLRPVVPPLAACEDDPTGPACARAVARLDNPFAVADDPGAFQTTGWLGAFVSVPSRWAVVAASPEDVAAAVTFAGEAGVLLAVKGTGHDYLGRNGAPGSLTVWTRPMHGAVAHEAFVPAGSPPDAPGVPALSVNAGTRWLEAYRAATAAGRYVQGGGCLSVGAAGGFTLGGGFGSFSKRYGTAAGQVLEAEVVTAAGEVLVVNDHRHADLFWALRGGGGGTFGVVTRLTYATHPLPATYGAVGGTIRATSDRAYRDLVAALVDLVPALDNEHFGEQVAFGPDNSVELSLTILDLPDGEAAAVVAPVLDWVERHPGDYATEVLVASVPFEAMWDPAWYDQLAPDVITRDARVDVPDDLFWWRTNQGEVSQYIAAYQSRWLPRRLFVDDPASLSDALYGASRRGRFALHLNKGLSGAPADARERDRRTSVHPGALEAAALLIMASSQAGAHPGVPGREPDLDLAAAQARAIAQAMGPVRELTPNAGTYVNEADYFEPDWQQAFWGENYPRLAEIKARWDPANLFRVHHGVGREVV